MEEKEMEEMFCFQCQQTAHNTGCEGHTGVCGKKSDTANLQDELTGELIRLARAVAENERSRSSDELMLKGLFTTITNVNFNSDTVKKLSDETREEAENRKPGKKEDCPGTKTQPETKNHVSDEDSARRDRRRS